MRKYCDDQNANKIELVVKTEDTKWYLNVIETEKIIVSI
jgi:hypothetical protein